MTQRSKITQLPSTTSTKKKKYEKKKKRKEKKKDEKKRKINKKANDQKVNYPKGERAKQTTYMAEKKNNNNIVANGGPLLCHTIKAISRRIFSNKEQCQLLIKDYNCFKTAATD